MLSYKYTQLFFIYIMLNRNRILDLDTLNISYTDIIIERTWLVGKTNKTFPQTL